jgi:hypothetical protein
MHDTMSSATFFGRQSAITVDGIRVAGLRLQFRVEKSLRQLGAGAWLRRRRVAR